MVRIQGDTKHLYQNKELEFSPSTKVIQFPFCLTETAKNCKLMPCNLKCCVYIIVYFMYRYMNNVLAAIKMI